MKLSQEQRNRLQNRFDVEVGRSMGKFELTDAYEIMDALRISDTLTKRQIRNMISKSKKSYGY